MLPIRTILHPTDFGECSAYALEFACGIASDYNAGLVIIHVVAAPVMNIQSGAHLALAGIREKLEGLDIPDDGIAVTRRIKNGNPATEILSMAQLCQADLIVMGSYRRPNLGSVAEFMLRHATCPVVTLTANCVAKHAGDKSKCGIAKPEITGYAMPQV